MPLLVTIAAAQNEAAQSSAARSRLIIKPQMGSSRTL
jgi:hypothetical protein